MKKCLVTRPEHDHTVHYLSKWVEPCIEQAVRKGIKVFDLHRERANRKEVESICAKEQPTLVLLNGHGSDSVVTGHANEDLIVAGKNEGHLNGKIIYALSCSSAKRLGPCAVKAKAQAYIGYDDDFVFERKDSDMTHPTKDELAKQYLEPSCELINALLKGHTVEESWKKAQDAYRANIRKLLASGADVQTLRYLWWDMKHQVCIGDRAARF